MTIYDGFLNQKLIWSRITPKRLGSSEKSNAPPFHTGKTRHLWFHSNSVWHNNIDSRRFSINKSSFGLIWFNSWWLIIVDLMNVVIVELNGELVLMIWKRFLPPWNLVSGVFDFELIRVDTGDSEMIGNWFGKCNSYLIDYTNK